MVLTYVPDNAALGGGIAGAMQGAANALASHQAMEPQRQAKRDAAGEAELLALAMGPQPGQAQQAPQPGVVQAPGVYGPPAPGSKEAAMLSIVEAGRPPEVDGPAMDPEVLAAHQEVMRGLSPEMAREYRLSVMEHAAREGMQQARAAAAEAWSRAALMGDLGEQGAQNAEAISQAILKGEADPFQAIAELQRAREQAAAIQTLQETKLRTMEFLEGMTSQAQQAGVPPSVMAELSAIKAAANAGIIEPEEAYEASIDARFGIKGRSRAQQPVAPEEARRRFVSDWVRKNGSLPSAADLAQFESMVSGGGAAGGASGMPQPDTTGEAAAFRDWQMKRQARTGGSGARIIPPGRREAIREDARAHAQAGPAAEPAPEAKPITEGQMRRLARLMRQGASLAEAVQKLGVDPRTLRITSEQVEKLKAQGKAEDKGEEGPRFPGLEPAGPLGPRGGRGLR